jgi:hypothetical protein
MTVGTFHSARKQSKLIRNSCGSLLGKVKGEMKERKKEPRVTSETASDGKHS